MLEQERTIYDAHLAEWLPEHTNRVVLTKGDQVVGFLNTYPDALVEGARLFGLCSFLARPVQATPETINAPALVLGLINANFQSAVGSAGARP